MRKLLRVTKLVRFCAASRAKVWVGIFEAWVRKHDRRSTWRRTEVIDDGKTG